MPNRQLLARALELLDSLTNPSKPPQPCTPTTDLTDKPHSAENPHNMPIPLHATLLHYRLLLLSHSKDNVISRLLETNLREHWTLNHPGESLQSADASRHATNGVNGINVEESNEFETVIRDEKGSEELLKAVLEVLAQVVANDINTSDILRKEYTHQLTRDIDSESIHSEDIDWSEKTGEFFDAYKAEPFRAAEIVLDKVRKSYDPAITI
ncbi:MAG: hypothetical protein M1814_004848 [Vezdaea aestivalis]|nr:MAG: hypothetical protein M1814_004848 [Vezdaea aestivalis]